MTETNRRLTQQQRMRDDLSKTEISNGTPAIKSPTENAFNSVFIQNDLLKEGEASGSSSSASVLKSA